MQIKIQTYHEVIRKSSLIHATRWNYMSVSVLDNDEVQGVPKTMCRYSHKLLVVQVSKELKLQTY